MKATIKQLEVYYLMRRYFACRSFPGAYHKISFENTLNVELWKFDLNGIKHEISITNGMVRLYKVVQNGELVQVGSSWHETSNQAIFFKYPGRK